MVRDQYLRWNPAGALDMLQCSMDGSIEAPPMFASIFLLQRNILERGT
jgi:hypothetical protein